MLPRRGHHSVMASGRGLKKIEGILWKQEVLGGSGLGGTETRQTRLRCCLEAVSTRVGLFRRPVASLVLLLSRTGTGSHGSLSQSVSVSMRWQRRLGGPRLQVRAQPRGEPLSFIVYT